MIPWAVAIASLSFAVACGNQANGQATAEATADEGPPPPAGSTCTDRCPTGQLCVEGHCRYRESSTAGEIAAAGAAAQLAVGDAVGALTSYEQALEAFSSAEVPVPPEVLCGAAKAALRVAADQETKEAAARRADACFRGSLPGDPLRVEVQAMLSRLRFDGLDMNAFDSAEPADAFFTQAPSRPTLDAVDVALSIGESEERGFDELSERLLGETAHHAIAGCFIEEWERTHERVKRADLLLKFRTRLRDMGDYDLYTPELEVVAGSGEGESEADAFSTCVAENLATTLNEDLSSFHGRVGSWEEPFEITARVN